MKISCRRKFCRLLVVHALKINTHFDLFDVKPNPDKCSSEISEYWFGLKYYSQAVEKPRHIRSRIRVLVAHS